MLKIFHIADLHLGRTFRNLPEAQETLSEARYETLQKTIDKANELETDIFVIAGDLFDRTSIKVGDIQMAVQAVNRFEEGDKVSTLYLHIPYFKRSG